MKTLLLLFCCLSVSVYAQDIYTPPIVPTEKEARQAQIDMEASKLVLRQHWQKRLETVKQKELQAPEANPIVNHVNQLNKRQHGEQGGAIPRRHAQIF